MNFICDFFCSDLTAYSLRKPLQKWNKKHRCAFKFSRMDSSKGNLFCGLDVAASKGYILLCSAKLKGCWGGGQVTGSLWNGRGESSVLELSVLPSLLAGFYAWEMLSRKKKEWCVDFTDCTVHLLKP